MAVWCMENSSKCTGALLQQFLARNHIPQVCQPLDSSDMSVIKVSLVLLVSQHQYGYFLIGFISKYNKQSMAYTIKQEPYVYVITCLGTIISPRDHF
jgi:hypothetical protein